MGGPSDMTLNMHFVSHVIGSYVGLHLPNPSPDEPNEMRLYGSEGVLIVGGGPGVRARSIRLARANGTVEERSVESDGGYLNEWINFHDALVHDEPIVRTIEQGFHNMLLVMRALDSAEEHRLIEIVEAPGGLCEMGVPLWRPRGARDLFEGLPSKVT